MCCSNVSWYRKSRDRKNSKSKNGKSYNNHVTKKKIKCQTRQFWVAMKRHVTVKLYLENLWCFSVGGNIVTWLWYKVKFTSTPNLSLKTYFYAMLDFLCNINFFLGTYPTYPHRPGNSSATPKRGKDSCLCVGKETGRGTGNYYSNACAHSTG